MQNHGHEQNPENKADCGTNYTAGIELVITFIATAYYLFGIINNISYAAGFKQKVEAGTPGAIAVDVFDITLSFLIALSAAYSHRSVNIRHQHADSSANDNEGATNASKEYSEADDSNPILNDADYTDSTLNPEDDHNPEDDPSSDAQKISDEYILLKPKPTLTWKQRGLLFFDFAAHQGEAGGPLTLGMDVIRAYFRLSYSAPAESLIIPAIATILAIPYAWVNNRTCANVFKENNLVETRQLTR